MCGDRLGTWLVSCVASGRVRGLRSQSSGFFEGGCEVG
mgnify:CR=1 FL=1